jgi:hypothetical protein
VDDRTRKWSLVALQRMLDITGAPAAAKQATPADVVD